MIGQIAARAEPVIHDREIWNEPDTGQFFTGSPAQYAQMLRAAHDAIKTIDRQAQVLLGGLSGPAAMPWLAQVLATPGADAAHAFDVAKSTSAPLDALAADVQRWRSFLAGYGFTGARQPHRALRLRGPVRGRRARSAGGRPGDRREAFVRGRPDDGVPLRADRPPVHQSRARGVVGVAGDPAGPPGLVRVRVGDGERSRARTGVARRGRAVGRGRRARAVDCA